MNSRIGNLVSNEEFSNFCKDNYIKKLSLFGLALTEKFDPESDIDLLVEFEDGHTPGIFKILRNGRRTIFFF